MISLTPGYGQYVKSGIEFVVNFCNGKIYLTDTEYCELSGIPIGRVLDRLDKMQEGTYWHDIQICPTHRKERGKKGVRIIPVETIFDWLLVDCRTIAERLARETDEFAVYSYRLAGSTIHLLESVRSILEALEQQKKDIELLKEQVKESAEKVKVQEIENLTTQEEANQLAEREAIERTANKESDKDPDDEPEDYLTVWQYLEAISEIGKNDSLNNAILLNAGAINFCQNRGIEPKEIISNRLGTVYAFPVSVLKQLDKKQKTVIDDEHEHYFTIPQYFNCVPNRQKKISLSDAITLNALAFNICTEKGIEIKQEAFTTLGIMNAFPVSVIKQVERYLNQ